MRATYIPRTMALQKCGLLCGPVRLNLIVKMMVIVLEMKYCT